MIIGSRPEVPSPKDQVQAAMVPSISVDREPSNATLRGDSSCGKGRYHFVLLASTGRFRQTWRAEDEHLSWRSPSPIGLYSRSAAARAVMLIGTARMASVSGVEYHPSH